MTDAKAAIRYLNGLSLQTIDDVEKILRALPQKGTPCEVQVSKPVSRSRPGRGTADVIEPSSLQIHDEPLWPDVDSSKKMKMKKKHRTSSECSEKKIECKLLAEHVRARPMDECLGVILEIDVEVTVGEKKKKKTLKLVIECPDFVPNRVKIGDKWKNII